MIRERIADDIYVFTSRRYAHVTCGAILTKEGVVLIDTLYFPDECREVQEFLENRLNQHVRYVINTHYHGDHTNGTYLYPQATVVSHALCRELLDTVGREGLERTKNQNPDFQDMEIVLPNLIVRAGTLDITIGGKQIRLIHFPGHSEDLMGVLIVDENVLFASDTMMPVPTFFDGDFAVLAESIQRVADMEPDTVVQGHGEIILRGEVPYAARSHLEYIRLAREEVAQIIEEGLPRESLESISIESCGKSRIPLNGFVTELHLANLQRLYDDAISERSKQQTV
jgi:glyoxylase-like metal-dependent hydrolase (beta-lactamase superfamily II)